MHINIYVVCLQASDPHFTCDLAGYALALGVPTQGQQLESAVSQLDALTSASHAASAVVQRQASVKKTLFFYF